jgi:hypothetical protein
MFLCFFFPDNVPVDKARGCDFFRKQAKRGFAAGAVLFDLGENGVFWQKKGVTLRGLRISEKKKSSAS